MSDLNLDSDDEPISLSAATLAALQEFQNEKKDRLEKFEQLYENSENRFSEKEISTDVIDKKIEDFEEDWNLSQFWYSNETADILAKEALKSIDVDLENLNEGKITKKLAIISAPSVYSAILRVLKEIKEKSSQDLSAKLNEILKNIYLLEFDARFRYLAVTPDYFIQYDYNKPLSVPKELKGTIDSCVIDPPYISDECQTKVALTARYLMPQNESKTSSKVIVCTGERVSKTILKVYPGAHMTTFFPEHANGLNNEFRCYSNFESSSWKFLTQE